MKQVYIPNALILATTILRASPNALLHAKSPLKQWCAIKIIWSFSKEQPLITHVALKVLAL